MKLITEQICQLIHVQTQLRASVIQGVKGIATKRKLRKGKIIFNICQSFDTNAIQLSVSRGSLNSTTVTVGGGPTGA